MHLQCISATRKRLSLSHPNRFYLSSTCVALRLFRSRLLSIVSILGIKRKRRQCVSFRMVLCVYGASWMHRLVINVFAMTTIEYQSTRIHIQHRRCKLVHLQCNDMRINRFKRHRIVKRRRSTEHRERERATQKITKRTRVYVRIFGYDARRSPVKDVTIDILRVQSHAICLYVALYIELESSGSRLKQ